jgi:hypothetical protein
LTVKAVLPELWAALVNSKVIFLAPRVGMAWEVVVSVTASKAVILCV